MRHPELLALPGSNSRHSVALQPRLSIAAFAGMPGVCAIGGREPHIGDGFVQSLSMLVGECGLDQRFERSPGIAPAEHARDNNPELGELRLAPVTPSPIPLDPV